MYIGRLSNSNSNSKSAIHLYIHIHKRTCMVYTSTLYLPDSYLGDIHAVKITR